jgi:hypothetical protein
MASRAVGVEPTETSAISRLSLVLRHRGHTLRARLAVGVAGVREHAREAEARQGRDRARHGGRLLGEDADAMEAAVDLQPDVETPVRGREHVAQRARAIHGVDPDRETDLLREREQPPSLVRSHHGIGHEDVVESRGGEDLGLRRLRQR